MHVSRRQFLRLGGGTAAAAALAPALFELEPLPRPAVRFVAAAAQDMPEPDLTALLLSRAAFGARPGDVERARAMGNDAWIEEQLDFEAIDDSPVEDRLRAALPSLAMTPAQLAAYGENNDLVPTELRLAMVYRMVYSPRALHEVMVEFWSDHFNIHHRTGACRFLKTVDDAEVIRRHALGTFRDLLTASATSPAMLNYLDNDVNTRDRPNENYGREIMELHTLGVAVAGVPYTEEDVKNVARCFTGWSWDRSRSSATYGRFQYVDRQHDQGPKTVLGQLIPAGLRDGDGREVIRRLLAHPATATHLATKLVRRFVTDDPQGQTPDLVERVARRYVDTDGDIREMVSSVLRSREFARSFAGYGGRLSRPMDFIVRALRTTGVPEDAFPLGTGRDNRLYQRLMGSLAAMGHLPFYWLTPDGYPDVKEAWTASSVTLTRWNFGLALAGVGGSRLGLQLVDGYNPLSSTPPAVTTAGAFVDFWIERLLGRPMAPDDRATVLSFLVPGGDEGAPLAAVGADRQKAAVALVLDSPYFSWR